MSAYTIHDLHTEGPPIAMAMLLACLKRGEPFVTYGQIRQALEKKLEVESIFSTQTGHVAGRLMDLIHSLDKKAPLINVLITRSNGIPGKGAGYYFARKYGKPRLRKWEKVPKETKVRLIDRERALIYKYRRWEEISESLFGTSRPWPISPLTEPDYPSNGRGGVAESAEHKKLKAWVAANPTCIGLPKGFGHGEVEVRLLSGDEMDVMFRNGTDFRAVEVKSIRSGDADLKKGIYQCVKYREVKIAEMQPFSVDVRAILVTERKLPPELLARARLLGVEHRCVLVNKRPKK